MSRVLVIAPHPDDETLGCGGTLFKHKANNDDIFWFIVTGISADTGWPVDKVKKREKSINNVKKNYGFSQVFNLQLPSTRLDILPFSDLIGEITNVYKEISPEIIYMPFNHDVHTDHQIIAKAFNSTFKWFRYPHIIRVLMYETLSETDFNFIENKKFCPNVFVNISKYIDMKIEAMSIYNDEMGEFPFPRSEKALRALATLRGSQSGYESAEAFDLVYERIK